MKLRIHVYICRACGSGRVNAQDGNGGWFTTFHLPDGRSVIAPATVPPCHVGLLTEKYLAKYADALSVPF